MNFEASISRARLARQPLIEAGKTNAVRLFHGNADGIEGLVVEQWADVLTAQFHMGHLKLPESEARGALDRLRQAVNARAVYRKVFVTDRAQVPPEIGAMHVSPQPWIGEAVEPEIVVRENGLRFRIRPYDGFSVGLFLEHRDNRQLVCGLARGRRVLNAFAYTCGFSVAAAAGGAASVSSVDLSRRYLEWGKRNFEENGICTDKHLFFCSDVFDFYERALRQKRRYDLIILDAPTFARVRRPKRTFSFEDDLRRLLEGAMQILDSGGLILLGTNARQISLDQMEREMQIVAGGRGWTVVERPPLPLDFPGDPDYSKTIIARVD